MAADPLTKRTVDNLLLENDDFDFNFDDDPFADKPTTSNRDDKATLSPRKRKADDDKENFGLGLDEEVKIIKKRKPVAKLDVERLLSHSGIPKLRELVRSGRVSKKLRFKGKGHEFSDAGRLLNYYQLWLDDLYPRAKFADALQLVEKAGHSKRMHIMRKAWIDEGKPGYARDKTFQEEMKQLESSATNVESKEKQDKAASGDEMGEDSMFFADHRDGTHQPSNAEPDDDELDALLAEEDLITPNNVAKHKPEEVESEGEDDLDALLADQEFRTRPKTAPIIEDEEDELDALLAAHESEHPSSTTQAPIAAAGSGLAGDEGAHRDADALDALLGNDGEVPEPELPSMHSSSSKDKSEQHPKAKIPGSEEVPDLVNTISSSPIPNVQTDDLDQLMDEHDAAQGKNNHEDETTGHFLSSSPIPNRDSQ